MRMQEHSRASIIIPVLLRCHLKQSWVRSKYLKAISHVFPGTVFAPTILIIQCFADMARSNSALLSRSVSTEKLRDMYRLVLQRCQAFQLLHQAAYEATLRGRRSKSVTQSPSPAPAPRRLSDALSSKTTTPQESSGTISISEFNEVTNTASQPISKGGLEFHCAQARPNVHIELHYLQQCLEYGTAWNCNMLIGEDKHRFYKAIVMLTNGRKVKKSLLLKENLQQTMRLILLDALQYAKPDLTATLHRLHALCPVLM